METTVYKLTDAERYTRRGQSGETRWRIGKTVTAPGGDLCTAGVIHAYCDPYVAVWMDPVHGNYGTNARMMEARGVVCVDDGTKIGLTSLTPVKWIDLPALTTNQRTHAGILAALEVYRDPGFVKWAENWISSKNRSARAAAAARAAAYATAARAAYAARAAADAAYADAAYAYATAARAARAARAAAADAAYAARAAAAAYSNKKINLALIIHSAIEAEGK